MGGCYLRETPILSFRIQTLDLGILFFCLEERNAKHRCQRLASLGPVFLFSSCRFPALGFDAEQVKVELKAPSFSVY